MGSSSLVDGRRVRAPEMTIQRIFEAALTVFGECGYERATVHQIVERAGYSKGAFYAHFASKEELFLALLERRGEENRPRVQALFRLRGGAAASLLTVLEALVDFSPAGRSWRALNLEFMAHGVRDPRIGRRIARLHAEWHRLLTEMLASCEEAADGRMVATPQAIATCVLALVDGLLIQGSLDEDSFRKESLLRQLAPLLRLWFREAAP